MSASQPLPVDQVIIKFIGQNLILGVESSGKTITYQLDPSVINRLLAQLFVASLDPMAKIQRQDVPLSRGGVEKVLTIPLERIAPSHNPETGTVSIVTTIPSGFRVAFQMSLQESLALSDGLRSAAGKTQVPKSTSRH